MARNNRRPSMSPEIQAAHAMAEISEKPTIVLVHGLTASPEDLEPLQNYYESMGFTVLNIDSPSGRGLWQTREMGQQTRYSEWLDREVTNTATGLAIPGSSASIYYLDQMIPPGSVVIGHSYGGAHVEEYAQYRAGQGLVDTNQYITIAGFAQDPINDEGANITRLGYALDPIVGWSQAAPYGQVYDHYVGSWGHGSSDWENWTYHINQAILEQQVGSFYGNPIIDGGSIYEQLARGGR